MLSKKTQYALKALEYLVAHYNQGPVLISEIAEQKHIPLKFLENILLELRHHDILDSKKGKGGGYMLRTEPEKTSLANVIRIVEGPIAMLPCVIHDLFIEARDAILNVLENKTLADLRQTALV